MRRIQTKLNTPTNSVEDLRTKPQKTVEKAPVQKPPTAEPPQTTQPSIPKQPYRPPSINLGTWSERPKTQISLKEDTDYRIKNANEPPRNSFSSSNFVGNNNDIVRVRTHTETNNVSIKVNGADPIIPQPTGNVIIKIGTHAQTTFRKPFEQKSRPHSIALDSNFDVSRVPIVRSVELKKNLVKDPQINKSVTQIYNTTNGNYANDANLRESKFYNHFSDYKNVPDKFSDHRRSTEALNGFKTNANKTPNFSIAGETKPVVRVNSFAINAAPTVRGFRTSESNDSSIYRKSWIAPNKSNNESKPESANCNVPFSQATLRKSESGRNLSSTNVNNNVNKSPFGNVVLRNTSSQNVINNNYRNSIAGFPSEKKDVPSPPIMPKVTSFTKKPQTRKTLPVEGDSRGQLLSDIRNFGGKKGLKAVKY